MIHQNNADVAGGAIFALQAQLNLIRANIGNYDTTHGAGIPGANNASLSIEDSTLAGNTAS